MRQKNKKATIKKIFLLLFLLILPWLVPKYVVCAAPQSVQKGSITISLEKTEAPKAQVAFQIYRVGIWDGKNWTLIEALKDTGISLETLQGASQWQEAAKELSTHEKLTLLSATPQEGAENSTLITRSGQTDEEGKLVLSELELGMYLVVQADNNSSIKIDPALVALPYVTDGVWECERTIYPKAELVSSAGDNTTSGNDTPSNGGSEEASTDNGRDTVTSEGDASSKPSDTSTKAPDRPTQTPVKKTDTQSAEQTQEQERQSTDEGALPTEEEADEQQNTESITGEYETATSDAEQNQEESNAADRNEENTGMSTTAVLAATAVTAVVVVPAATIGAAKLGVWKGFKGIKGFWRHNR